MKNVVKRICHFLSAAVMMSSFGAVPVTAAKPTDSEVFIFDTLKKQESFIYNSATYMFEGRTESGFGYGSYEKGNITFAEEKKDGIGYEHYFSADKNGVFTDVLFGKIIDSGKLHISYSLRPHENQYQMYIPAADTKDSDTIDGYDADKLNHSSYNLLFKKINEVNGAIGVSPDGDTNGADNMEWSGAPLAAGKWYKADIIYDLDAKRYDVYINGVKHGSGAFIHDGIKGIRGGDSSYVSGYDIDDLYVHSYADTDKIYLATEGLKELPDGTFYLSLAPSEYVEGLNAYGLTIKDAATGEDILDLTDDADFVETTTNGDGKIYIQLPKEVAGRDFIISGKNISGSTSGAKEIEAVTITVPGTAKAGSDRYYFMNETFESSEIGTVPAGWSGTGMVTASETNTVKITDGTIAHAFPLNTPVTDNFTIEFDVKRDENKAWSLDGTLYGNSGAKVSFLTADTDGKIGFGADRSGTITESSLNNPPEWEHIKLAVDMGSGVYTVTAGTVVEQLQTTLLGMFAAGISGIEFGGSAAVDNVKIYKNTKYYLNDDFNSMSSKYHKVLWNGDITHPDAPNDKYNPQEVAAEKLADISFGVENVGYTDTYEWKKYFSSGGWFDPDITNYVNLNDADNKNRPETYLSNVRAFGITPTAGETESVASSTGDLMQADTESASNYWTKEKAAAGDKVLFVAPRLIDLNSAKYAEPKQRRIVKYFDRAITPGTPFTMEFLMHVGSSNWVQEPFGISLIEKGQEPDNQNNLLLGYTGNASGAGEKEDAYRAMAAPNTDTSLETVLKSKAENAVILTSGSDKLSLGYWANGHWGDSSHVKNFLPTSNTLKKVTVTVTPNTDGTTTIGYSIQQSEDKTFSGKATVQRNFKTKELIGMAFDTYDLTWSNGGTDTGTLGVNYWSDVCRMGAYGIMYDDLKVFETAASNPGVYVKSVTEVDYADNQTEINGKITDSAKAVAVNFSAPAANSSIQTDGIIELIDISDNRTVEALKTLSSDGKTVYISPQKGFTAGKSYYLSVNNNLEFEPNNASQLIESFICKISCSEGNKLEIYKTRLVNPILKDGAYTYEQLRPAKFETINTCGTNPTKLYVDGYSANGGDELAAVIAYYDTVDGISTLADVQWIPFTTEKGGFSKSFEIEPPSEYKSVQAFVWMNNNTYKPLINAIGLAKAE